MGLMRRVLDSLLPPGPLWNPKTGGSMDAFLDGVSDSLQSSHDFIAALAYVRNPYMTPMLADLEAEFGVSPSDGATTAQRQANLAWKILSRGQKGQYWVLQQALTLAGFTGAQVIPNDPAVNPAPFLAGTPQTWCGGFTSVCGYYTGGSAPPYGAFCASFGANAMLIVNGNQFVNNEEYIGCGNSALQCHSVWTEQASMNGCGYFTYVNSIAVNWGPPSDYWRWPLVFFIAGGATYDGAGHVLTLAQCSIPNARVKEFISIILHYKPIHTWALLVYGTT